MLKFSQIKALIGLHSFSEAEVKYAIAPTMLWTEYTYLYIPTVEGDILAVLNRFHKIKVKQAFPYTQDQWEVLDHLEEHGHTFMRTLIKNCWKLGHSAQIDLNCASMSGIRILFTRADARFR